MTWSRAPTPPAPPPPYSLYAFFQPPPFTATATAARDCATVLGGAECSAALAILRSHTGSEGVQRAACERLRDIAQWGDAHGLHCIPLAQEPTTSSHSTGSGAAMGASISGDSSSATRAAAARAQASLVGAGAAEALTAALRRLVSTPTLKLRSPEAAGAACAALSSLSCGPYAWHGKTDIDRNKIYACICIYLYIVSIYIHINT